MFAAHNLMHTQGQVFTQPTTQGSATANTTSVTLPTHAIGDIIILAVPRVNATPATKPTASGTVPAWADIDAATGSSATSIRTAYFVATATNHTTGTWTGATCMWAIVLRGQGGTLIGGHGTQINASGSSTAPAVTLTQTDGTSVILEFHFTTAGSSPRFTGTPTGYTRLTVTGTIASIVANSKNVTTTDGSVVQTLATTGANAGATIEICAH